LKIRIQSIRYKTTLIESHRSAKTTPVRDSHSPNQIQKKTTLAIQNK
jgi:hypothetical protein